MNFLYLSDSAGNTTEAFIPIEEWQVNEVKDRLADYKKNPNQSLDFDSAIADIEKDF